MSRWIYSLKQAAKLIADTRIVLLNWDEDWASIGAFPYADSTLTAANVRGQLRRAFADNNCVLDILETDQRTDFRNLSTGVVFRFRPMTEADFPSQKRKPVRAFVPPDPTEQLQLKML